MLKVKQLNILLFSFLFLLFYLDISSYLDGKLQDVKWLFFIIVIIFLPIINGLCYSTKHNFLLFSFFILILIGSTFMHSGVTTNSLKYLLPYIILYFFYFVITFSKREKIIDEALISFYYVTLVIILISSLLILNTSSYSGGRFDGIFSNTNALAGVATLFLVFALYKNQENKSLFTIFVLFLTILIIFLTKSRTALATIAILFIVYSLINNKGGIFFRLILLMLTIFVIINIQEVFIFLTSFLSMEGGISSEFRSFDNVDNRLYIIERQLISFYNSPIFGVGVVIDRSDILSRFGGESTYLDLLSMSGFIGISIFLLIIIRNLKIFLLENRFTFLSILAISLLSIFEGYISNVGSVLTLIFWLLIAKGSKGSLKKKE